MSAALQLVPASGDGTPIELPSAGALVLGSDPERATVVVSGGAVAKAHCAIGRLAEGGWAIKDLGSRAGTRVDGKRVRTARLQAGQELDLGGAKLRVVDPSSPRAGAVRRRHPETIGGYRVQKPLGRGGMGDVYLAVQESLDRPVALKVLHARLAGDAEFVGRFQKEARSAAALNHPNVVHVYDVGTADGYHYLSMEFMEQGNLEERLARGGPLPVDEALDVLCAAARGLTYAESRGILHCDIKPANLMLGAPGEVKIADLGLARELESGGEGKPARGGAQRVFGTPHFISPEQARGEKLDARSDVYSLGATAFQLLTGKTPFQGQDALTILRARFEHDAPRADSVRPDLPSGVVDVIAQCLEREPDKRPATAEQLLAALERQRSLASTGARGGRSPLAIGGALLLLVGAGGAGAWWLLGSRADPEQDPPPAAAASAPGTSGQPPVASALPGFDTAPTTDATERPDDDAELRQFELDAMGAYGSIALDRDASPGARVEALRKVASDYAGTDAAAQASREANELQAPLAAAEAEEQAREVAAAALAAELDRLLADFESPPRPAAALVALAHFNPLAGSAPPQPGLTADLDAPGLDARVASAADANELDGDGADDSAATQRRLAWELARTRRARAVVSAAADHVATTWSAIDRALSAGAFDTAETLLGELEIVLDDAPLQAGKATEATEAAQPSVQFDPITGAPLPSEPADAGAQVETDAPDAGASDAAAPAYPALADVPDFELPEPWAALRLEAPRVEAKLAELPALRRAFARAQLRADARGFAALLRSTDGVEFQLRQWNFAAARARLSAALPELATTEFRARAQALDEWIASAAEAPAVVINALGRDAWRRRSLPTPGARRSSCEVQAVDAEGFRLEHRDGSTERVPWSSYFADVPLLRQVFLGRLDADYTLGQSESIANLLALAGTIDAAGRARSYLGPGATTDLDPGALEALRASLAPALEWENAPAAATRIRSEAAAVADLATALEAAAVGAWSRAAVGVERLFEDRGAALFVSLLSDGDAVAAPAEDKAPDPSASPDASEPLPTGSSPTSSDD